MNKIEFINLLNNACNEASEKGALFNKPVVFAQAALESGWGNSELASKANNLFSIKAGPTWAGDSIWVSAKEWSDKYGWYAAKSKWRKYSSWTDCIMDYARILADVSWYQGALQYLDDPKRFLKALLPDGAKPGWATDPDYYNKIIKTAIELEFYGGPKWT